MKYLCLGYLNSKEMDSRPKDEIDAIMGQCRPHMEAMYQTGQVLMDAGLSNQTKELRRRQGKLVITDGPFAETKELLGAAILIEAPDMDEAVRIAALHPTTQILEGEQLGWRLEIRPVDYFK